VQEEHQILVQEQEDVYLLLQHVPLLQYLQLGVVAALAMVFPTHFAELQEDPVVVERQIRIIHVVQLIMVQEFVVKAIPEILVIQEILVVPVVVKVLKEVFNPLLVQQQVGQVELVLM
tara:strand:- start:265 stop:618 length:354 start_codon:yes stop_codon:yes gene_type:complete